MASFYVLTFRCHWWAGVRSGYDLACGSPLRLSARKEPAHWDPPYERREERDPPAGSFGGSISGYVFSRVADDETFVSDSRTSPDVDPPLPPFVGPWWAARMGENGWTGKEYLENQPKEMKELVRILSRSILLHSRGGDSLGRLIIYLSLETTTRESFPPGLQAPGSSSLSSRTFRVFLFFFYGKVREDKKTQAWRPPHFVGS